MADFKTIKTENSALRSCVATLKILSENDGWKQKVEIWLLNDEVNNNDWQYLNLAEHRHLFAETPILIAYVGNQIGDGHNFQELRDQNGEVRASFMSATAERIVGFFSKESDIRLEVKDGKNWVVGTGYIWRWYALELVDKLKKQGLEGMSVSIETLIDEMHRNGSTEVFTKYQILGTTILGDDVNPAVSGAHIRALSAIGANELREMTIKVASEQQKQVINKNPQTNQKKENKTVMNKKSLEGKFDGYRVIAVNGEKVALLSADKHEAFVSTAVKDNGTIVEGVKTAVNATVVFGEGENEMKVALDSVIDGFTAENAQLKTEIADKDKTIKALTEANEKLVKSEKDRRREAVKNAIKTRFDEIKANSDCEFAENECDDLLTDEKLDAYVEMEENGRFIGDEKARCDIDSRCMAKILSVNKTRANAQKKQYAWDNPMPKAGDNEDGVNAVINRLTKLD